MYTHVNPTNYQHMLDLVYTWIEFDSRPCFKFEKKKHLTPLFMQTRIPPLVPVDLCHTVRYEAHRVNPYFSATPKSVSYFQC